MARTAEQAAKLSSQIWAALGYLAGKRTDRDQIVEGSRTPVKLRVTGTVGRAKVDEAIDGHLARSHSQTKASTSAAKADHVVAILLAELPEKDRYFAVKTIAEEAEATGELPPVTKEQLAEANQFLKRLRSTKQKTTSGAIVFELKG
ncbi:MAG: hypothetical protein Aurels2KO_25480 [Aureliella sp.]